MFSKHFKEQKSLERSRVHTSAYSTARLYCGKEFMIWVALVTITVAKEGCTATSKQHPVHILCTLYESVSINHPHPYQITLDRRRRTQMVHD